MQNQASAFLPGDDLVRTILVNEPMEQLHPGEGHPEPVAAAAFVEGMRGAVTGVNIVTTDGAAGRFGVTVSAFSSVSAEPPMVLVCINQRSPVSVTSYPNPLDFGRLKQPIDAIRCHDKNIHALRRRRRENPPQSPPGDRPWRVT